MINIGVITGSTRPGRRSEAVARWLLDVASQRGDAEYELVDLADHHLPHLDEPQPAAAGQYTRDHTRRWADTIARFDGFVIVTPEYNHAAPGVLKNALDFLYQEWNDKAAGFVSYGVAGGVRAVEQLRAVMSELRVADVRAQVALSLRDDFVDMTTPAPQPFQVDAVSAMLDQLVAWSGALRPLRDASQTSAVS